MFPTIEEDKHMECMDIGMVGMAVMGSNLALNMADHGFQVACYNYTPDLTERFVTEHPHKNAHPFYDLKAFVAALKKPRKIMMMIMAGKPVDSMIEQLIPLLEAGDIIIDGGNSFFGDTMRRYELCKSHGLNFFGTGISGGETGARRGPCIMPTNPFAPFSKPSPRRRTARRAARTSARAAPAISSRWCTMASSTPTCSSSPSRICC